MDDKLELLLSGQQYKKFQEIYFEEIIEMYCLSLFDLRVLLFLKEHDSCDTAKDIVDKHFLTKSYVSKSIDRLLERGYLKKKNIEGDRRYIHLEIQKDAFPVLDALARQKKKMLEQLFRGIREEELEALGRTAFLLNYNICEALSSNEKKKVHV